MRHSLLLLAFAAVVAPVAKAQDAPALLEQITRIAQAESQVAGYAAELADEIGSRLANSPGARRAERWGQERFNQIGLQRVRAEPAPFGRGWSIRSHRLSMTAPRPLSLRSIPITWTPGTDGEVTAPVILAPMASEADFERWRGQLRGRIVMVSAPTPPQDATVPNFRRFSPDDLAARAAEPFNVPPMSVMERMADGLRFAARRDAFLAEEGALAWLAMSRRGEGFLHGEGGDFRIGATPRVPGIEVAAEDYRRLARLSRSGPVEVRLLSDVAFHDEDPNAYNIIGELPGRAGGRDHVLAGAHLDTWAAADGAADNGAGVAIVLEAARILSRIDRRPRRTIRFALWSAEEPGVHGSDAYVRSHLATRPRHPDPFLGSISAVYSTQTAPVTRRAGFDDLVAYFNVDNGSGRVRGVYTSGNDAAGAVLRQWMAPLGALGVSEVMPQAGGGSDHVLFALLGYPSFQLVQDPLDYGPVAHSSADTFDHLREQDLRQAAIALAYFLYRAADSEARLPVNAALRSRFAR